MDEQRVYIVLLRRPKQNPDESRADPYYECGSFGCTRCHTKNLMKPDEKAERMSGGRLAFAQGGDGGFRLVLLTPPVTIRRWRDRCEALWAPAEMPFRYTAAPILVCNDGRSDFPGLRRLAARTGRGEDKPEGGFASLFRGRRRPLEAELAAEVVRVYDHLRKSASGSSVSQVYTDSMPYAPPSPNHLRRETYAALIAELGSTTVAQPSPYNARSLCGRESKRMVPSKPATGECGVN